MGTLTTIVDGVLGNADLSPKEIFAIHIVVNITTIGYNKYKKNKIEKNLKDNLNNNGTVNIINDDFKINGDSVKTDGIKNWNEISNMLSKEGVDEKKISEILSISKGSRPDPITYLSQEYIDAHLSYFQNGVTKINSKAPIDTEGIGLGTFVMPKSVADDVIKQAGGSVSKLEELLGLNPGDLGMNPVRVDISNPQNLRIPSGNEVGAWPGYWTPGGYTKPGGVMEAVIDPVPKTEYIVTENILGK